MLKNVQLRENILFFPPVFARHYDPDGTFKIEQDGSKVNLKNTVLALSTLSLTRLYVVSVGPRFHKRIRQGQDIDLFNRFNFSCMVLRPRGDQFLLIT